MPHHVESGARKFWERERRSQQEGGEARAGWLGRGGAGAAALDDAGVGGAERRVPAPRRGARNVSCPALDSPRPGDALARGCWPRPAPLQPRRPQPARGDAPRGAPDLGPSLFCPRHRMLGPVGKPELKARPGPAQRFTSPLNAVCAAFITERGVHTFSTHQVLINSPNIQRARPALRLLPSRLPHAPRRSERS